MESMVNSENMHHQPFHVHMNLNSKSEYENENKNGSMEGSLTKSIQELVEVEGIQFVPSKYIRGEGDRPFFDSIQYKSVVDGEEQEQPPIIKMSSLLQTHQSEERNKMIQSIGKACEEWGFFQVVNDGFISERVSEIWKAARMFYALPMEGRMKYYSKDLRKKVSYMTSYNPSKDKIHEWKDSLVFRYIPNDYDQFQDAPHFCRDPVINYMKEMRWLASQIYRALSESLGLEPYSLEEAINGGKITIPIHYYPPCPDPSLTLGFSAHSDPNAITIILQDHVGGLQVARNHGQRWIPLNPNPNAFIVNIGDQIQILSNGKYKSVEHRVVTNSKNPRMSIACLFCPPLDTIVSPLPSILHKEKSPALYKPTRFRDYLDNFNKIGIGSKSSLDFCSVLNHHP